MPNKPTAISLTAGNFVAEESELIRNGLPQDLANEIYENGGFVASFMGCS
jgi:hypothetical protein